VEVVQEEDTVVVEVTVQVVMVALAVVAEVHLAEAAVLVDLEVEVLVVEVPEEVGNSYWTEIIIRWYIKFGETAEF